MRTNSLFFFFLILTACAGLFSACRSTESNAPQPQTLSQKLAEGNNLTILRAAITRAGLDAQLGQAGTLTLFAPTDAAFQAAGYANAAAISAVPIDTLKRLLQYHILPTKLLSASITIGVNMPQPTVAGPAVYITKTLTTTATSTTAVSTTATSTTGTSTSTTSATTTNAGGVSVNGAHIIQADIEATNGVVHAIDKLLVPPTGDIIQTLGRLSKQGPSSFTLLTTALTRAGSTTTLRGTGPYTVFAPTDVAFTNFSYKDTTAINKQTPAALADLLNYQVVSGRLFTTNLQNNLFLTTLQGGQLITQIANAGTYYIANAGQTTKLVQTDIVATNGVIHTVDFILVR